MLGKLFKYDFKWIYKVVIIFNILTIIFAILTKIFGSIDNSVLFSIIHSILLGVTISMMVSSLINTVLRSWARFINNVYKDESYLTHTLPVSKSQIFMAKIFSAVLCIFISVVVILISLFIMFYSKENVEYLKDLLELAANTYNTTVINLIMIIALIFFLEILLTIVIGYVGIILGFRENNKILKSLIYGFLIYMVTQVLLLVFVFVFGLINPDIMNLINTSKEISVDAIKSIMYMAILLYLGFDLLYIGIGNKILGKGVNVL